MINQNPTLNNTTEVQLPPQRFFWAMLDASSLKERVTPTQLGYLFESVLPIPIEEVQAVYCPLRELQGRQFLACAMSHQSLHQTIKDSTGDRELQRLGPSDLPQFIKEKLGNSPIELTTLNLLVGRYEPTRVTRLRSRWQWQMMIGVALVAVLITIGMQRRITQSKHELQALESARQMLINQILPDASKSQLPVELQLMSELRTLRQTRGRPIDNAVDQDCSDVLAGLLKSWPNDLHVETESLLVNAGGITIRGAAPSSADVQGLADALSKIGNDWQVQQPQINAGRELVQATIQLKLVKELTR